MTTEFPQVFSERVGLTITEVEPGYSRGTLTVTDDLKNPHGMLHGAVLYTMADTGMGAALSPELGDDEVCATIELKINYLQPVHDGDVTCETILESKGKSIAYLESDLRQDGESVARATGSFSIFTP